jgi:hypothetical protein
MLIIGHPWVKSQKFHNVFSLEDIKESHADEIILLEALADSHTLAQYCQGNSIAYAVEIASLDEALFANALGAKYMLCEETIALIVQPIAQEYLFDTRVLVPIDNKKEIAKIAKSGIDGVIFTEAIDS